MADPLDLEGQERREGLYGGWRWRRCATMNAVPALVARIRGLERALEQVESLGLLSLSYRDGEEDSVFFDANDRKRLPELAAYLRSKGEREQ